MRLILSSKMGFPHTFIIALLHNKISVPYILWGQALNKLVNLLIFSHIFESNLFRTIRNNLKLIINNCSQQKLIHNICRSKWFKQVLPKWQQMSRKTGSLKTRLNSRQCFCRSHFQALVNSALVGNTAEFEVPTFFLRFSGLKMNQKSSILDLAGTKNRIKL